MSWGKVHTGELWWGEGGILPILTPSETRVFMYLTAKCGELKKHRTVTVLEIVEATGLSYNSASTAIKTLLNLGLFEARNDRDSHGQFYRTFKRGTPPWNEAEVLMFTAARRTRAAARSQRARDIVKEYGTLQRGRPAPVSPDKASSEETGGGRLRSNVKTASGSTLKPPPVKPEKLEQVEDLKRGGTVETSEGSDLPPTAEEVLHSLTERVRDHYPNTEQDARDFRLYEAAIIPEELKDQKSELMTTAWETVHGKAMRA